ncbi:MAG TPA: ATP-binding protein [Candidatus Polarisedimenticolia bacterium]|nr:ATP-binding protein [Candidatus Polarisedimenticolia bacterium]
MRQDRLRRAREQAARGSRLVGKKVTLRLGSRIGYVDLVHEMAEDLARWARFPKPAALNIALAVREAFINAIKHGNRMDSSKSVEVQFERRVDRFRVSVRDEGNGFDWRRTADPREEENLFRPGGRGIFFMKHFVDHVAFLNRKGRGTEVVLEKRIQPNTRPLRDGQAIKRRKG